MARITRAQLEELCQKIQDATGNDRYLIYGMNGAYALSERIGGGITNISPWLTKGQLYDWVWAYLRGIREGIRITEEE